MPARVLPSLDQVRDLEILLRAHHPLVVVETVEEDRVATLLSYVADRLRLPVYEWSAHRGLTSVDARAAVPTDTVDPVKCLEHVGRSREEAIYHLRGFARELAEPVVAARVKALYRQLFQHRGAIVITGADASLPPDLEPLFTAVDLEPPSQQAYYQFVASVLRDLRKRMNVQVDLTSEDVGVLLGLMRGLTFFEVKKIVTQAVIEDGKLSREDIAAVLEAKKRIIQRSGVLDYYPAEDRLADVAGLDALKGWLRKRKAAFADPERAKEFGLTAPRGLLLLGVQGCGKSLCAKAVASEWSLPLVRLDPSNLYNKFHGESERNLRRAIRMAEDMAPIVLWIDEIEKAFASSDSESSGTSQRIFGTFLTWLNDKKESVFVIATANDISRLPPELMRKGRFDEIFFVDLPDAATREAIFALHLARRGRSPDDFALGELARATEGFSGAEIEQVVVSALYTAFGEHAEVTDGTLLEEIRTTRPLSVTMSEKVAALREWAKDRAVPA